MAGEWQEVPGGWMQAPDPDEPDVDYFEADRLPMVARRADVILQAVDEMMTPSFDLDTVWTMCEERLPPGVVDSAGSVAFELEKVENRYDDE
jgi:hypothetical protein